MVFQESPFLSRDDSVSIMDGTDEGKISEVVSGALLTSHQASSQIWSKLLDHSDFVCL